MIAIMGDTFSRVIENKDVNATKMKLELLSDMFATLKNTTKDLETKHFIFIVQPDDAQNDENWEGSINHISRLVNENVNKMGE